MFRSGARDILEQRSVVGQIADVVWSSDSKLPEMGVDSQNSPGMKKRPDEQYNIRQTVPLSETAFCNSVVSSIAHSPEEQNKTGTAGRLNRGVQEGVRLRDPRGQRPAGRSFYRLQ